MAEIVICKVEYVQESCWCGHPILLSRTLERKFLEDGTAIYCPLGHSCVIKETEVGKLKKQIESANRKLVEERLAKEKAQESALEETQKRMRLEKRVKAGVCPYCKRSFPNIARHMKCRHAEKP